MGTLHTLCNSIGSRMTPLFQSIAQFAAMFAAAYLAAYLLIAAAEKLLE